jgi:hypothetical protein
VVVINPLFAVKYYLVFNIISLLQRGGSSIVG